MRILHTADWHLDAVMAGLGEENTQTLRRELRKLPEKICKLCKTHNCDLLLIAGDLFDGAYTPETMTALRSALSGLDIPVVITPGNHDFITGDSPYEKEEWPRNIHIFKHAKITALPLPELDCILYGAGYESMDCPGLLKGFHVEGDARWHIGVLHAEANTATSNYCPITRHQLQESGLHYVALGHVHKAGSLKAGETLCAWPGCPMGKGFDELGQKGVILVDLDEEITVSPLLLDTPRFYDEEVEAGEDAHSALSAILPAVESSDFYRVTLTGYSAGIDLDALRNQFSHIANLQLRDETIPEVDLWSNIDQDSLEGVYFSLLKEAAQSDSEVLSRRAMLAARISRKILDGQEVKLP